MTDYASIHPEEVRLGFAAIRNHVRKNPKVGNSPIERYLSTAIQYWRGQGLTNKAIAAELEQHTGLSRTARQIERLRRHWNLPVPQPAVAEN